MGEITTGKLSIGFITLPFWVLVFSCFVFVFFLPYCSHFQSSFLTPLCFCVQKPLDGNAAAGSQAALPAIREKAPGSGVWMGSRDRQTGTSTNPRLGDVGQERQFRGGKKHCLASHEVLWWVTRWPETSFLQDVTPPDSWHKWHST